MSGIPACHACLRSAGGSDVYLVNKRGVDIMAAGSNTLYFVYKLIVFLVSKADIVAASAAVFCVLNTAVANIKVKLCMVKNYAEFYLLRTFN